MQDIFVYENFFDRNFIKLLFDEVQTNGESVDFIDNIGIFKGQLIAKQKLFENVSLPNLNIALEKIKNIFDCSIIFREILFQTLYLPWDIHSDWTPQDSSESYYNLLIPLQDVESRTIIFDQRSSDTKHFYIYKQQKEKCANPIPVDIWEENLNFCWAEDREYLSIKQIMPYQKTGQLMGFLRDYYHSSDNFHTKNIGPKYFLQILVDRK